ncbi:MAG: DUF2304 domain-containing protein [Gemmatimonadetes bacterium]|nr:DUF2304 domain-containing protein [Gemmatimonadota bacterium]
MDRVQWVSILASAGLLGIVLELVRRRRLQERYSLLWIFTAAVLLLLSLWRGLLDRLAFLVGIHYPPSALFLVGLAFFLVILLHFSVVHSEHAERVKELGQRLAQLERRVASAESDESGRGPA